MEILLSGVTFGDLEIDEVIDSLRSGQVTMGAKCRAFEAAFAAYSSARHAVFVNSGSSANLLAWFALANSTWKLPFAPGFEVIVPAVAWSTTIWPIVQAGGIPVLVDCDPSSLTINIAAVEAAISDKTAAVCPVHPLGNVCDMTALTALCERHNLVLVEDTCEALGSRHDGTLAGRFGLMGTYSFYFSHHITTVEGGMIVTDDDDLAALLRVLRSHGWSREELAATSIPFDQRYRFITTGFNVRPSDLNAAFGLHQLAKLDGFNTRRIEATSSLLTQLKPLIDAGRLTPMRVDANVDAAFFGFPVMCRTPEERDALAEYLEANGIETRPIICGNMARQPAMNHVPHRVSGNLEGADAVMDRGLYWGVHPNFTDVETDYITKVLGDFAWQ